MKRPLIGITTARLDKVLTGPEFIGCRAGYPDGIAAAGGLPVLIPLTADPRATLDLANDLDGILFTGGEDVNPHRYGVSERHPKTDVDDRRDELEFSLLDHVKRTKKPALGVCRGMQLMAVSFGGELHQYLPDNVGVDHMDRTAERWTAVRHTLKIESGIVARCVGTDTIDVNSLHQQGVKMLPEGCELRVVSRSDDGIVEIIEGKDPNWFLVGIEGHPEALWESTEPRWLGLFKGFVRACSAYASSKSA